MPVGDFGKLEGPAAVAEQGFELGGEHVGAGGGTWGVEEDVELGAGQVGDAELQGEGGVVLPVERGGRRGLEQGVVVSEGRLGLHAGVEEGRGPQGAG